VKTTEPKMMFCAVTFLVFFLITTSTIAQDVTTVGSGGGSPVKRLPTARIVGGTDVPFGTYPWFAKAMKGDDDWAGKFISVTLTTTAVTIY
jgi:hypothetical protein